MQKSRRPYARYLFFAVGVAVILLMPAQSLVSVQRDHAGWELASRPLTELIHQGLWQQHIALSVVTFNGDEFTHTLPCITRVRYDIGLITWVRHYRWNKPGDRPATAKQRFQACQTQRQHWLHRANTLAAALRSGNIHEVKQQLNHALTDTPELALSLNQVGQPLRQTIAAIMSMDEHDDVPVTRFSVAVALKDKAAITQALMAMPWTDYDASVRYALYQQHLLATARTYVAQHANDRTVATHSAAGFQSSDYDIANIQCDADFAGYLSRQHLAPDDDTIMHAFAIRLVLDNPDALVGLNFDNNLLLSLAAYRQTNKDNTPPPIQQCTDLITHYRHHALNGDLLDKLADIVGADMLTQYRQYAAAQQQDKHFTNAAEEDDFYQHLEFNQHTSPLPALPAMFVTLLKGRPSGPAVCSALQILPRFMGHDNALALFDELAKSWRHAPIDQWNKLAQCRPGLVFSTSYIPQQTAQQNAFLKKANIACHVHTPTGPYIYHQQITCADEN